MIRQTKLFLILVYVIAIICPTSVFGKGAAIHTWLEGLTSSNIVECEVSVLIESRTDLGENASSSLIDHGLWFWAIQVDFTDGTRAHGGLQWTECSATGVMDKTVNWGTYEDFHGNEVVNEICASTSDFEWAFDQLYIYRIVRITDQGPPYEWAFMVDWVGNTDNPVIIGIIEAGQYIANNVAYPGRNNPMIFTEYGWITDEYNGTTCEDPMESTWTTPRFYTEDGGITWPTETIASFNDLVGCSKTDQDYLGGGA